MKIAGLGRTGAVTAAGMLALASTLHSQQQRPQVAGPQSGTAQIAGRVVAADQPGTPLRRVLVTITGPALRFPDLSATNDEGRFVFRNLPAGRFTISATKAGYVRQYYGAKRPGVAAGVPVVVAAGQRADVSMALTRAGAIAGTLLLPPGVPAQSLRVHLLRAETADGERRLVSAGGGAYGVDSDGSFRLARLMPGDYQLLVTAAGGLIELQPTTPAMIQWATPSAGTVATVVAPPAPRLTTFSPVYFPGTVRPADAGAITVSAGQDRDVTFTVPLVPSARVSGRILDATGQPPPAFQVWLIDESAPVPRLSLQPRLERDGRFSVGGVTPGPYLLVSRASRQGAPATGPVPPGHSETHVTDPTLWAMESINVTGDDLTDLQLTLQPGRTITGRVTTAPGSTDVAPRVRVSIAPLSSTLWGVSAPAVETNPEGRFEIPHVVPGRYRISIAPVGAGPDASRWVPQSAIVSGRDLLDETLQVPRDADPAPIVVTMTDRVTEFSGRVLDSASRPLTEFAVVVFSVDAAHWKAGSRRVVQARPGSDGLFVFSGLPPGEYYVCAVTDVEAAQLADGSFLQQLVPSSFRITLAEGEKKRQDMRVGSGG
jgi:hypothetical protein